MILSLTVFLIFLLTLSLGVFAGDNGGGDEPRYMTYRVVRKAKHDSSSFVEGLLFTNEGQILESAGLTGQSRLKLFDLEVVEDERDKVFVKHDSSLSAPKLEDTSVSLKKGEFAEGITIIPYDSDLVTELSVEKLNEGEFLVAQLTYKAKRMHILRLKKPDSGLSHKVEVSLKFAAGIREGWGIAYDEDGKELWMGDGSSVLYSLGVSESKDSLVIKRSLAIHDCYNGMASIHGLNELEFVSDKIIPSMKGSEGTENFQSLEAIKEEISLMEAFREHSEPKSELWANVIGTHCIASVDTFDGQVKAWISMEGIDDDFDKFQKVLNGIAYDKNQNSLWVTGKNWKWIYEIELLEYENSFDPSILCKSPWYATQTTAETTFNC